VLNGLPHHGAGVQAIVVTLAMFFSLQGLVLLIATNPVSISDSGWGQHARRVQVGPITAACSPSGCACYIWFTCGWCRSAPVVRRGSKRQTAFSSESTSKRCGWRATGCGLFAGIGGMALTGLVNQAKRQAPPRHPGRDRGGRAGRHPLVGGAAAWAARPPERSPSTCAELLATFAINPPTAVVYGGILQS